MLFQVNRYFGSQLAAWTQLFFIFARRFRTNTCRLRLDAGKRSDLPHAPPSQRHERRLPRDMPWRVVETLPHHRTPDPAGMSATVPLASSSTDAQAHAGYPRHGTASPACAPAGAGSLHEGNTCDRLRTSNANGEPT
ncbi:hypothetical protein ACN8ZM_17985 [Burkholderia aenigmatica]|uniref:hypothetical protein n=1 Tax=Burkholderia aenigmatica TaxID=2015348 RepID=UPI003B42B6ED